MYIYIYSIILHCLSQMTTLGHFCPTVRTLEGCLPIVFLSVFLIFLSRHPSNRVAFFPTHPNTKPTRSSELGSRFRDHRTSPVGPKNHRSARERSSGLGGREGPCGSRGPCGPGSEGRAVVSRTCGQPARENPIPKGETVLLHNIPA